MKKKLKTYELLLQEINNKANKQCVNYRIYDHEFPCWNSIEDEYICDILSLAAHVEHCKKVLENIKNNK